MIHEFYYRRAAKAYADELEAAIHRFRECGVEIERFSLKYLPNGITHLCIDGIPRFSIGMNYDLAEDRIQRTYDPMIPHIDPRRRK